MTLWFIRQFSERLSARELRLCCLVNRYFCERTLWRYFALVSRLGDGVFWYLLILLLALFGGQRGSAASVHMAVVGVLTLALYKTLKHWSKRPRPLKRSDGLIIKVAPLDEFSFPSGHTLHAVSFTWVALCYVPELMLLLIPFTLSVAASRVVLGLHYPSDVLAASVLGAALAETSMRALGA
jgi:undecaprenyl-diphosphatase